MSRAHGHFGWHSHGPVRIQRSARTFRVYDVHDYREIPYFVAVNFSVETVKRGELVYDQNCGVRT